MNAIVVLNLCDEFRFFVYYNVLRVVELNHFFEWFLNDSVKKDFAFKEVAYFIRS